MTVHFNNPCGINFKGKLSGNKIGKEVNLLGKSAAQYMNKQTARANSEPLYKKQAGVNYLEIMKNLRSHK